MATRREKPASVVPSSPVARRSSATLKSPPKKSALAEASIPAHRRWIPKGMEVSYTAKAASDITCIAETDAEQWSSGDPDLPVRVRGVREDGTVVVEGVIRLWVTERS